MESSLKTLTTCYEASIGTQSCHPYDIETEYFNDIDNGLHDWDPNEILQPLIPLKYTATTESSISMSPTYNDDDDDVEDKKEILNDDIFEVFFNTFIDSDLEGEITICQWTSSFLELCGNLTEKQIYTLFNYIDQEKSGYIDCVDFVRFCNDKHFDENYTANLDKNGDIQLLRDRLITAIKDHPFTTNIINRNA